MSNDGKSTTEDDVMNFTSLQKEINTYDRGNENSGGALLTFYECEGNVSDCTFTNNTVKRG